MKILCSVCLEKLDVTSYPGLGDYVTPCDCAADREREVAKEAAGMTCQELENWFADIVEEFHCQVKLDNNDDPDALRHLDQLLSEIVRVDTKPNFDSDPYDNLEIANN